MFLRNKHVIIAMIVAPILAVLAWLLTDNFVSEKPHKAVGGQAYEMVAKSNCRYASGSCELFNGDFKLVLQPEISDGGMILNIDSNFALNGIKISLAENSYLDSVPQQMQVLNDERTKWRANLPAPHNKNSHLRLAISLKQSLFYADIETIFTTKESFLPDI